MRFKGLLITGLLACGVVLGGEDYGAGELWNKVKSKFGTKEGIKQNADIPLKTDRPMTNVAGTESFDVRVQCPSRREGIKITFLPLSGNDYRLLIREDLDRDGRYEYVYDTNSAGVRVSGVCYSGIVSCDGGGTWNNCKYYVWDAGNSGYVSLVPTDDTSLLGGCFCSNSSCRVNTLAQEIVDYISGGISQAVMRARNDLGVSKANFDAGTMTQNLYVQSAQGCSYGGSTIYGETSPTGVYNTQTPPDGLSYVATHPEVQNSPDSPYYLVNKASQVQYQGRSISYPSRVSCDIRKDVAVYTTDMYESCSETWTDENGEVWCVDYFFVPSSWLCPGRVVASSCGPVSWDVGRGIPWLNCVKENGFGVCGILVTYNEEGAMESCSVGVGENYNRGGIYYKRHYFTLKPYQKYGVFFKEYRGGRGGCRADKALIAKDVYKNEILLEEGADWRCSIDTWFAYSIPSAKQETAIIDAEWYGCDKFESNRYKVKLGVGFIRSQVYKGDVSNLSETNTCPTDNNCVIKNEWVCDNRGENCIQTVREGVRTGLTPQPMCYQTNTQIGNYFVCAYGDRIEVRGNPDIYSQTYTGSEMWFWIKREYECPPESIDIDLTRPSAVLQDPGTGYDSNTGEFNVADYSCSNGVCSPSDNYTANLGTPDSCPVAMCTVRTTQTDTSVFADRTNRFQTPGGSQGSVLEVRSCQRDTGGNWVCPHEDTETVVEACRCDQGLDSTGFTTSITVLQGVVDASKDIICSSVSP